MIDTFFISAVVTGLLLIISTAPLGCLMIWRRMAFFGDATSHAAILGVGLALLLDVSVWLGILCITLLTAVIVARLARQAHVPDTLLAVISPSALAFGLVGVSLSDNRSLNLEAYLFGDILTIPSGEIAMIGAISIAVASVVAWRWNAILTSTISPELAVVSGQSPRKEGMVVALCIALVIAISVKVIGALLIAGLLVVPAAAARYVARSPEAMVGFSALFSASAVILGTFISFIADTPTGPTIICVAAMIFAITSVAFHR